VNEDDGFPGSGLAAFKAMGPNNVDGEVEGLEPEVRDWEPRAALVGPDLTEAVVSAAWHCLRPGGFLVLETHASAAQDVAELVRARGYDAGRITRDLAGRERVVEGRRP